MEQELEMESDLPPPATEGELLLAFRSLTPARQEVMLAMAGSVYAMPPADRLPAVKPDWVVH
jgi:hypothetical protein